MKDLYKMLGVSETADQETIKKAFRKLAKQYHPDATGGDKRKAERFKDVNEAYSVLGDEKKRREYDRLKHAPMGIDGMPQGFDPESFAQVFGGRGGFRSGGFEDFGDLFGSLFGARGGRAGARAGPARGQDMTGRLEVGFRDAALGAERVVHTGSGDAARVQVPPGVDTGSRLRIPGHGGRASRGGPPGDLFLDVVVTPDPVLRRDEDDVLLDLPLSVAEATLGAKLDVPTVDGTVCLTIPPGTPGGAKLRLRGKGIRRPDGGRGDQICQVQVVVPRLGPEDAESRRLIEELDRRTRGARIRSF